MRKNEETNKEIHHRFLVILPGLAVIALGVIYALGYVQNRLIFLHPDVVEFEATTAHASQRLDSLLGGVVNELQEASVRAVRSRTPVSDQELLDLASESDYFDHFCLFDTFGSLIAGDPLLPASDQFVELLQQALDGKSVVSSPISDPENGEHERVYVFVPILDDSGQPLYALCGDIPMGAVWEKLGDQSYANGAMIALKNAGIHAGRRPWKCFAPGTLRGMAAVANRLACLSAVLSAFGATALATVMPSLLAGRETGSIRSMTRDRGQRPGSPRAREQTHRDRR